MLSMNAPFCVHFVWSEINVDWRNYMMKYYEKQKGIKVYKKGENK